MDVTIKKAEKEQYLHLYQLSLELKEYTHSLRPDLEKKPVYSDNSKKEFFELIDAPNTLCLVAIAETNQIVGFVKSEHLN